MKINHKVPGKLILVETIGSRSLDGLQPPSSFASARIIHTGRESEARGGWTPPKKRITSAPQYTTSLFFHPEVFFFFFFLQGQCVHSPETWPTTARKSSSTVHNISRGEEGCSSSPLEANIYSGCGVRLPRGSALREDEVPAAHSSHLEPSAGRETAEGEGPTQKEYKAEVISPGDEDSSTSFPHHHLSLTLGPRSQQRQPITPGH